MTRRMPAGAAPGGTGPVAGWIAVGLLLAAYAVSFLDRQIISLLVQPLKADLGISDTQIGILQGPAFGLFYAVLGLPLGWLADRVNRVRLISLAIALWSAMTVASGLASSFEGLLLARIGVGVGEAPNVRCGQSWNTAVLAASRTLQVSRYSLCTSAGPLTAQRSST